MKKSELDPKQVFDLVSYPVRPERGQGQTHSGALAELNDKDIRSYVWSGLVCPAQQLMSHIGPLTVALSQGTRITRKIIPIPRSLTFHPHLKWWLEEDNILQGQPLHPLKHALQIFTDTSKEGWGAHLGEHTTRGMSSLPESKLHIHVCYLELKAVFLALKEFQDLCLNNIVLIATDNTTVVAYINKEERG